MDKHIIRRTIMRISTKEQLLDLLNKMKKDEAESNGNAEYYPFEIKQLNYYCNPNHEKRFRNFTIPKKSGGKRTISAPNHSLLNILYYVNEIFKAFYRPNDYAFGFVEGRNIVDNARKHVGQNYVFNIDLSDFFTSIDQARVWGRLKAKPFCFKQSMANIIAGLCSMKMTMPDGTIRYVLPQGAPTSPILTNMICQRMDEQLGRLAAKYKVNYSRYADDMTFSSMHNIYQEGSSFRKELRAIIEGQNFRINDKKTRLNVRGVRTRQEVTGLTVNEKPNVTRSYVKNIRAILHIWERFGHDEAQKRFLPFYIKEGKAKKLKGIPHVENVLEGKLLFMKMVKGENDPTFAKLWNRYENLVNQGKPVPTRRRLKPMTNMTKSVEDILHLPKEIVEFLSNFTNANSSLKYTTHTWDTSVAKDFDTFVSKYQEQLDENEFWNTDFVRCSPELYYMIKNFLDNENIGENYWGRYQLRIGYLSPKGYMKSWMDANPGKQPSEMPLNILPKELIPSREQTDGETLVNFDQVINIFKESIEFRGNNFFYMIRRVFDRDEIILDNSEMSSLRGYNFYTHTYKIELVLKQILENIIYRNRKEGVTPTIKIWAKCNEDKTHLCLHILNVDSFSDSNFFANKKLSLAGRGNMLDIVYNLRSLCDFYVESRFRDDDGKLRHGVISYLYTTKDGHPLPKIYWIDGESLGFDYILKFYL